MWSEDEVERLEKHWESRPPHPIAEYVPPNATTILDAGCGIGRYVSQLWNPKRKYVGLDSSKSMLKRADELYGHLPGVSFVYGDVETFEFDEKFDVVVCMDVIRHLLYEEGLNAIKNLMKQCRLVFIFTANLYDEPYYHKRKDDFLDHTYRLEDLREAIMRPARRYFVEKWPHHPWEKHIFVVDCR